MASNSSLEVVSLLFSYLDIIPFLPVEFAILFISVALFITSLPFTKGVYVTFNVIPEFKETF